MARRQAGEHKRAADWRRRVSPADFFASRRMFLDVSQAFQCSCQNIESVAEVRLHSAPPPRLQPRFLAASFCVTRSTRPTRAAARRLFHAARRGHYRHNDSRPLSNTPPEPSARGCRCDSAKCLLHPALIFHADERHGWSCASIGLMKFRRRLKWCQ